MITGSGEELTKAMTKAMSSFVIYVQENEPNFKKGDARHNGANPLPNTAAAAPTATSSKSPSPTPSKANSNEMPIFLAIALAGLLQDGHFSTFKGGNP